MALRPKVVRRGIAPEGVSWHKVRAGGRHQNAAEYCVWYCGFGRELTKEKKGNDLREVWGSFCRRVHASDGGEFIHLRDAAYEHGG